MKKLHLLGIFSSLLILLVACGGEDASIAESDIETDEPLYTLEFDNQDDFETGEHADQNASLSIVDGVYIIQQNGAESRYIWGRGGDNAQDVVVKVQTESIEDYDNNLYGVMCRVTDEGEGYAFLVSNDGFGSIAYIRNSRAGNSLNLIADWVQSDAINSGTAKNEIRAICVGDYFALYVNDTFILEAEDDRLSDAGQAGLIAGLPIEPGDEGRVEVHFDQLSLSEARLK